MDVFATIVAPAEHQQAAIALSEGTCGFSAAFTTDPQGAPPATHFISSGYIPQEIVTAFQADARFTVSADRWTVVAASMGLTRVQYL
jgi:hypothetical protein